jgi:hypothetical protein
MLSPYAGALFSSLSAMEERCVRKCMVSARWHNVPHYKRHNAAISMPEAWRPPDLLAWSLHSPEDFFLWGNLKNEVYRTFPGCVNKLKVNPAEAISAINQDRLLAVTNNVLMWCQTCTNSQLQDVIFKKQSL